MAYHGNYILAGMARGDYWVLEVDRDTGRIMWQNTSGGCFLATDGVCVANIITATDAGGRAQSGRSGLFAINKLIYRVAGGGQQDGASASAAQRDRRDELGVDDEGEIPAFLRRQAN